MSTTDRPFFTELFETAFSAGRTASNETLFATPIRLVKRIFDVPLCVVFLPSGGQSEALQGPDGNAVDLSLLRPFLERVLAAGEPLVMEDSMIEIQRGEQPLVGEASGIRFGVGVPLPMGNEVVGVLAILDRKPRAFGPDDVAQLNDVAKIILDQLQLYRWVGERTASEQEIRSSRDRLQAVVTERGRIDQQLLMTDRLASVGTLAAGVAHEINNPLAYILMNMDFVTTHLQKLRAEVVVREGLSDRYSPLPGTSVQEIDDLREALQEARDGAERVRRVVQDLRIFARGEDLERTSTIRMDDVLDSAVGIVANEIRHRATLLKEYGELPPIQGNEAQLAQVFVNLLLNAAHSLDPEQYQENRIRIATHTSPRGEAVIEVSDTGCGIAPETMSRLFDPFFTTKTVGQGTGLGLSICHRIVKDTGGDIAVESEEGKGSTFRVTIPALHATAPSEPVQSKPLGKGKRVLIIDDEDGIRRAVTRILGADYTVTAVSSVEKALALLEAEPFDVILCDLLMPGVTGMELRPAMEERNLTLPGMVFMTGGAFTEQSRLFLEQTSSPCLEKPFTEADLLAALAKVSPARVPSSIGD